MAERKRWDKQQDFHPSSGSSTPDAKADPVLTKQLQYIKVLEERNRVKKRLAAASKRNDRLQEREEAFVTAFNVPKRAAQPTSSSSLSSRNTRSAPSTALNFAASGDEEKEHNQVRRAKWNRPQAPMGVAVQHHDGVPLFRLTTQEETSEEKEGEDEEDEEENYLEESFEEFEEEDEREYSRGRVEELVIEDNEEEEDNDATVEEVDLSKTTKELFAIIQHLSRSKQRALVDVLHKFQSSDQDENDVKVLEKSIGDPALWKEITSALNPSATETVNDTSVATSGASVTPVNTLIEEQLRLEDEYANKVKERLTREREEKQRLIKEAEERRAKMMKRLEDEEREIERLMEVKRQERLAKLRALQEEADAAEPVSVVAPLSTAKLDDQAESTRTKKTEVKGKKRRESHDISLVDEELHADAKSSSKASEQSGTVQRASKESVPMVPRLNLSFTSSLKPTARSESHEIHVKLLSTWGRTRAVGLTQICVYDLNGEELSVDLETLQLYDQPTGRPLPKTNDMVSSSSDSK
ncbi:hypothetical protein JG688_00012074 [Phytophthora aleatoria]|uniref:KATNIP domain-containing protein n=1 Tax=Phytophthora aleatoria TaxID=2496075 RepID=A0A8J5MEH5_9STRA|nr:hypothetical protein JG688_00012074 [Phytophthora aleatoria]